MDMATGIETLITNCADTTIREIAQKVMRRERISPEDGLALFEKGDLALLGALGHISTAIFILNPRMYVCLPASSAPTPACMHTATRDGNCLCSRCLIS
jgi:2-iminoacetate synthase ThiH